MTLRGLWNGWVKFWFAPQLPTPIALFRICYGLLVLDAAVLHIGPDVLDWLGPHAVTSADAVHRYWWLGEPRFDIFLICPATDAATMVFWYVFVAAIFCLVIGFKTRAASVIVCLYLTSIDNRQPFAINGGDSMMKILSGYIIFSEAGAAFSVDRLIKRWQTPTFGEASRLQPSAPYGQRLIQLQMAIAYWSTFCAKISGAQWLDGTAVYYATRLDDMINNPMPLYDSMLFCKFLTWYTIFFEGAMWSLIWVRELRYFVLAGTLVMHFGIDYSINLPIFEWIFMSSFLTFIYPQDLTKCMDFIKNQLYTRLGPATPLLYNPGKAVQTSRSSVIEGLDVFGRLNIAPMKEGDPIGLGLVAMTKYGTLAGFDLFAWLTGRLPLLWCCYPFIGLPWSVLKHPQSAQSLESVKSESKSSDAVAQAESPKSDGEKPVAQSESKSTDEKPVAESESKSNDEKPVAESESNTNGEKSVDASESKTNDEKSVDASESTSNERNPGAETESKSNGDNAVSESQAKSNEVSSVAESESKSE